MDSFGTSTRHFLVTGGFQALKFCYLLVLLSLIMSANGAFFHRSNSPRTANSTTSLGRVNPLQPLRF
jgi:hypothetical protein